jgi:exodeoxyribonuclease VII small subunit
MAAEQNAAPGSGEPGDEVARGAAGAGSLSYEQARDELVEVVRRLEAGGLPLEQSLRLWERGEQLAAICQEWLEGARARLTAAMASHAEGTDPQAPF